MSQAETAQADGSEVDFQEIVLWDQNPILMSWKEQQLGLS